MNDLLAFLTNSSEVSEEVIVYTDKAALLNYRKVEREINTCRDSEQLKKLEELKSELREKIVENSVRVHLTLPSPETRKDLSGIVMSEYRLDTVDDIARNETFLEDLTTRLICASTERIEYPDGVEEGPFEIEDFRAFKSAIASVPDNWNRVVETYNLMTSTELLNRAEFESPDFL